MGNEKRGFIKYFRDMNGDLSWSSKDEEAPPPQKVYTEEDLDEGEVMEDEDDLDFDPFNVKVKKPVEYYKSYKKADTGKLYSQMGNKYLQENKKLLMNEMGVGKESRNEFVINPYAPADPDPLNCLIK